MGPKKTPDKSAKTVENASRGSHYPTHPPWSDMITECITTTPDGTGHGVSRPAIKKFVDSKYHLAMDAVTAGQLNRAIAHGTRNGDFILPKGPSGKVKLAPKREDVIAKENKKPFSKRPAETKVGGRAKKPSVLATKSKVPPFTEERIPKTMPATRKYTSMAKKARVTPIPGRKVPTRPRKATTKRGSAKQALTGSSVSIAKTRSVAKSVKRTGK